VKPKNSANIVGEKVRLARQSHTPKITQDALSGRLAARGVPLDRAGIAKIENGLRGVSDFEVKAFSKSLNVSASWLLGLTHNVTKEL